jgi:hypothetical protein
MVYLAVWVAEEKVKKIFENSSKPMSFCKAWTQARADKDRPRSKDRETLKGQTTLGEQRLAFLAAAQAFRAE